MALGRRPPARREMLVRSVDVWILGSACANGNRRRQRHGTHADKVVGGSGAQDSRPGGSEGPSSAARRRRARPTAPRGTASATRCAGALAFNDAPLHGEHSRSVTQVMCTARERTLEGRHYARALRPRLRRQQVAACQRPTGTRRWRMQILCAIESGMRGRNGNRSQVARGTDTHLGPRPVRLASSAQRQSANRDVSTHSSAAADARPHRRARQRRRR